MDPMSNFAVTQDGGTRRGSLLHGNGESAKTALKEVKLGNKEIALLVNCSKDTTLAGDLEKLKNSWNTANPTIQKVLIQILLAEPDSLNAKIHDIKTALQKIKDTLDSGKNVLVNCSAGVNRSTTILIMYLMEHEKMTIWDAWKLVHSKRNVACPMPTFVFELWDDELWAIMSSTKDQRLGDHNDIKFFSDVITAKGGDGQFLNPYFNIHKALGGGGLYQYGNLAGGAFKFDDVLEPSLEAYTDTSYMELCKIFKFVWPEITNFSKKPSRPMAAAPPPVPKRGGTRRKRSQKSKTKRLIKFYY